MRPTSKQTRAPTPTTAPPNTQFVMGGMKGMHPSLTQLGGDGNLIHTSDYRSLYASLLRDWWGFSGTQSEKVLGGKYGAIPLFA